MKNKENITSFTVQISHFFIGDNNKYQVDSFKERNIAI